ncbi:anti-sigma factor [Christiangramia fulva]|uniref:Anti-sigma factor n=1 Tax=Christiangramia fulva TaxID=2126553 RepID=A0A2R3Z751_9FLAO|nr:anti-sigma factor [Christiangramia fulva]AVR46107.1 anti-sigma factor [Christiangramia fulva]
MDNIEEYISSGILELYVYGALDEKESREVSEALEQNPQLKKEVEEIERSLQQLSAGVAPHNPASLLKEIRRKLSKNDVKTIPPERKTPWPSYIGWAASILLFVGLFFMIKENNELREQLNSEQIKNTRIEQQIVDAREDAENAKNLLAAIRSREISRISLQGQKAAPKAFATVYWNKEENKAFIDAKELPPPPRGKVYQVWSLKLNPLTPTSIGLLENFQSDENKIFSLENPNESEAFGITLEPEGGSKSPSMDQLYVLGTVASNP